jgi:CubicO group peptidase (beta-lactamase class C family)
MAAPPAEADLLQLGKAAGKLGFTLDGPELVQLYSRVASAPPEQGIGNITPFEVPAGLEEAVARAGTAPFSSKNFASFKIGGTVVAGFEGVRDAFASNFARGLERDAQLCIYWRGERVVDLWGSNTEPGMSMAGEHGYDGDTLQIVYSSTKAAAAAVFAVAADRGLFAYSDPVCKHWPEFGQAGKEAMTIADVLRHDAGLHTFAEAVTLDDIKSQADPSGRMAQVIAATPAWKWADGPAKGQTPRIYHGLTRGFVLNQILIRADPKGRTVGQWMHEELCGPIGASFYCGPHEDGWTDRPRVEMQRPDSSFIFANAQLGDHIRRLFPDKNPAPPAMQAMAKLARGPHGKLTPDRDNQGRKGAMMGPLAPPDIEAPSASGRANARGMAAVMALLANGGELNGVRVLSAAGVAAATENTVPAKDRDFLPELNFMGATAFCQGGWDDFTHPLGRNSMLYGSAAFGWGGAGGSIIWFNPAENIGFGYSVTGFAAGLNGDQMRGEPLLRALQGTPMLPRQGKL